MLTTRGKSFLRALLTDDYLRHMNSICLYQLSHMQDHPGEPLTTVFGYLSTDTDEIDIMAKSMIDSDDYMGASPTWSGDSQWNWRQIAAPYVTI